MAKNPKPGVPLPDLEQLSSESIPSDQLMPLVQLDPNATPMHPAALLKVQAAPRTVARFRPEHYEAQAAIEKAHLPPLETLNRKGGFASQAIIGPQGESSKVVGCALGEKIVDGRFTGQKAVLVFVTKKLADRHLPEGALVPHETPNGIPTDVIEVGQFRALAGFQSRERPARCGSSVGTSELSGTIGALVQLDNGMLAILSNNHVLAASNAAQIGATIIQPGAGGGDGGLDPQDFIAKLTRFVTIAFPGPNLVDCAAAQTSFDNVSPEFHTYPTIDPTPIEAENLMAVRKEGRTTGLTLGQVFATNFTVDVQYETADGTQSARFINQIAIRSSETNPFGGRRLFSDEGDSGSLIVEASSFNPVGLLFAGDSSSGITSANPIAEVIKQLKILRFIAQDE